jgi:hypothetical protein
VLGLDLHVLVRLAPIDDEIRRLDLQAQRPRERVAMRRSFRQTASAVSLYG